MTSTPDARGRRDCACPRARHVHGTLAAYKRDRCRCVQCCRANADAACAFRRVTAQRRWNGGSAWTDATGTRRRAQALAAAGWSAAELSPHLGISQSGVRWLRHLTGRCLQSTADKMTAVYADLWWREPAGPAVVKTINWAAKSGWAEPWQWDGIDIDNPATQPLAVADGLDEIAVERIMHGTLRIPPFVTSPPELIEAIRRLHQRGMGDKAIGERVGRSIDAVLKLRHRGLERAA